MELKLFHNKPWDALTTDELRMVARAVTVASEGGSYSLEGVFLHLLLDVNQLDVLYANAEPNPDTGELEQVYYVRERRDGALPFAIPLYALQYWVKPKKDGGGGCIDWLVAGSRRTKSPEAPRGFSAPANLMSDVTWQQYRAISDYFDQYAKINNAVRHATLTAASSGDQANIPSSPLRGTEGVRLLAKARAQWLASIFSRRILHRDRQSGLLTYSFSYRAGQATANEHYFAHVSPVDFQMILFWWEGMQNYLKRRYPKCFKRGAPGNDTQDPLSLYSRSIATLEKFTGSDEDAINQKTYTVVLQQFNDMVEQNEEYERMRKSK